MDCLSKDEILSLLRAARAESERDWLMILVAFTHGLRASEIVHLTRNNISGEWIIISRLKGSLRTKQPLLDNPEILLSERQPMLDLCKKHYGNQELFPISRTTFWRRIQYYGRIAKLPKAKLHPHVLKHSLAMQIIDSMGIHRAAAWLGHKSISSTGKYLNPTNDEVAEAARRALGGIPTN